MADKSKPVAKAKLTPKILTVRHDQESDEDESILQKFKKYQVIDDIDDVDDIDDFDDIDDLHVINEKNERIKKYKKHNLAKPRINVKNQSNKFALNISEDESQVKNLDLPTMRFENKISNDLSKGNQFENVKRDEVNKKGEKGMQSPNNKIILKGCKRDPNKSNRDIQKDKINKAQGDIAKKLESGLIPPGMETEVDLQEIKALKKMTKTLPHNAITSPNQMADLVRNSDPSTDGKPNKQDCDFFPNQFEIFDSNQYYLPKYDKKSPDKFLNIRRSRGDDRIERTKYKVMEKREKSERRFETYRRSHSTERTSLSRIRYMPMERMRNRGDRSPERVYRRSPSREFEDRKRMKVERKIVELERIYRRESPSPIKYSYNRQFKRSPKYDVPLRSKDKRSISRRSISRQSMSRRSMSRRSMSRESMSKSKGRKYKEFSMRTSDLKRLRSPTKIINTDDYYKGNTKNVIEDDLFNTSMPPPFYTAPEPNYVPPPFEPITYPAPAIFPTDPNSYYAYGAAAPYAPEYTAPEYTAPEYTAPEYTAPYTTMMPNIAENYFQGSYVAPSFNSANTIDPASYMYNTQTDFSSSMGVTYPEPQVVTTRLTAQRKLMIIKRCQEDVQKLDYIHYPNKLISKPHSKNIESKIEDSSSFLNQDTDNLFDFTCKSKKFGEILLNSIKCTVNYNNKMDIENNTPKEGTSNNLKTMINISVQTEEFECDECVIRNNTKYINKGTMTKFNNPGKATQVNAEDLASSKMMFTTNELSTAEPLGMSLMHMTPAQILDAALSKSTSMMSTTLHQPKYLLQEEQNIQTRPGMFGAPYSYQQNRNNNQNNEKQIDFDSRISSQSYTAPKNNPPRQNNPQGFRQANPVITTRNNRNNPSNQHIPKSVNVVNPSLQDLKDQFLLMNRVSSSHALAPQSSNRKPRLLSSPQSFKMSHQQTVTGNKSSYNSMNNPNQPPGRNNYQGNKGYNQDYSNNMNN